MLFFLKGGEGVDFEELAKGLASIFAPPSLLPLARMCCSSPQKDVSASSSHSGPHLPLWERMELKPPEETRSGKKKKKKGRGAFSPLGLRVDTIPNDKNPNQQNQNK